LISVGARIEAENPTPLVYIDRDADAPRDRTDVNVAVIDVASNRVVQDIFVE
jgi:hypothetical protein